MCQMLTLLLEQCHFQLPLLGIRSYTQSVLLVQPCVDAHTRRARNVPCSIANHPGNGVPWEAYIHPSQGASIEYAAFVFMIKAHRQASDGAPLSHGAGWLHSSVFWGFSWYLCSRTGGQAVTCYTSFLSEKCMQLNVPQRPLKTLRIILCICCPIQLKYVLTQLPS